MWIYPLGAGSGFRRFWIFVFLKVGSGSSFLESDPDLDFLESDQDLIFSGVESGYSFFLGLDPDLVFKGRTWICFKSFKTAEFIRW